MNLPELKSELDDDSLARGYAAMSDAEAAADLNSAYRTRLAPISSAELLAWAAANGRFAAIEEAAESHADQGVKSIARAASVMIRRDGTQLDLSLPDRMAMLDALAAANVLTGNDKDDLVDKASVPASRAEELGLGTVTPSDTANARRL